MIRIPPRAELSPGTPLTPAIGMETVPVMTFLVPSTLALLYKIPPYDRACLLGAEYYTNS